MANPHLTRARCWKCKGAGEINIHRDGWGLMDVPCGVCDGTGEDDLLTLARAVCENPGDAFALDSLRETVEQIDNARKKTT